MIEVLNIDQVDPGVGYVYRWVNLVNGKMYIGSHDGGDEKYTASGIAIRRAFKKHGMENFVREFLYVGADFRKEEERFLLLVDAAFNKDYYNLKNSAVGAGSGKNNTFYGKKHSPETLEILSAAAKVRMSVSGNPMKGRKHSDESRAKMSQNTDVLGEKNPMFGYVWTEEQRENQRLKILGTTHSDETKAKISASMTGESNPFYGKTHSDTARRKISEAAKNRPSPMLGRTHSEEVRKILSEKTKNGPRVLCPHCPKEGPKGLMTRWHLDNCKYKK